MKIDFMEQAIKNVLEEYGLTEDMSLKDCVEKQVAKKPIFKFKYEDGTQFYDCPICGQYVMHAGVQSKKQYCSHCGQKLDWSDEE